MNTTQTRLRTALRWQRLQASGLLAFLDLPTGTLLADMCKRKLVAVEVLLMVCDVASLLQGLHGKGYVLTNLKAANLLFLPSCHQWCLASVRNTMRIGLPPCTASSCTYSYELLPMATSYLPIATRFLPELWFQWSQASFKFFCGRLCFAWTIDLSSERKLQCR